MSKIDSVLARLESDGRVEISSPQQIARARTLFVDKFMCEGDVAKQIGVPIRVVVSWVYAFQWTQERNTNLQAIVDRNAAILMRDLIPLNEKADKTAHTIETVVEQYVDSLLEAPPGSIDVKKLEKIAQILERVSTVRNSILRTTSGGTPYKRLSTSVPNGEIVKQANARLVEEWDKRLGEDIIQEDKEFEPRDVGDSI